MQGPETPLKEEQLLPCSYVLRCLALPRTAAGAALEIWTGPVLTGQKEQGGITGES